MSNYNYDADPWADPNTPADQPGQQSQGGFASYSGSYHEGYSNPAAQYLADGTNSQVGQSYDWNAEQFNDYAQQQASSGSNYDQQQQADPNLSQMEQDQKPESSNQPSAFGRFIRQRIPLCGSILDMLCSINLPFIDALAQNINKDLLVSKMFYFFFYSAFGSLFPLMGVYFKQLGMNPAQVGILTGVRPFIEIFSAPFWNSLAERFNKSKDLLLFSLISWILFTYSLDHIRPPASACIAYNDSHYVLYTPYSANDLSNYDVGGLESKSDNESDLGTQTSGAKGENEGKDQILASEENQNAQRRRRRSISGRDMDFNHRKARYSYAMLDKYHPPESLKDSSLKLDIDIDDDFDDEPMSSSMSKSQKRFTRHAMLANDGDAEDDGMLGISEIDESLKYEEEEKKMKEKKLKKDRGEDDESNENEESDIEEKNQATHNSHHKATNHHEEQEGDSDESDNDDHTKGKEEDSVRGDERRGEVSAPMNVPQLTTTTTEPTTTTTQPSEESTHAGSDRPKSRKVFKQRHKTPPTHIVGMSPITVEYASNYKEEKHKHFVTPMFSTIVYKLDDIKEVFFLLLLLISLGEFFSAPALTLADRATLSYLGENTDAYCKQRMFGSLSWAVTLLLVGMALDNATSISDHPCGPHARERSYTVCFMIFSLLMACAFLTATQFRFKDAKRGLGAHAGAGAPAENGPGGQALVASAIDDNGVVTTTTLSSSTKDIDDLYATTQPRSIFNTAPPVNAPSVQGSAKEKFEFLDKWKSAVFAQRTGELPEWINVFRQFKNTLHFTYLFITWFLGCGVGLVFTFLFWHLQDIGGTPTLFGICSVINHISEILAYFFSFNFIKRYGHTKVLSVGLGCNLVRFLYVAFLTDPYYALPFELVQGITHAACFAACCSYISHKSKPELKASTQGVMQGLHHGIGRACGALMGGYMINAIGSRASFCIYGLLSGCVLAGFLYVRKKASQLELEEEVKDVDASEALGGYGAPQGVPSTAMPGKITQSTGATQEYQW